MPNPQFARSDLLYTQLLEGDIGGAQVAWPALWEGAEDSDSVDDLADRGSPRRTRAPRSRSFAEPAESAIEWGATAVELTLQTRRAKYEAQARSLLGRALIRLDRRAEGIAELRRAVDIADRLVNPAGRWHAHAALADGLGAAGDEAGRGVRDARGARDRDGVRRGARARARRRRCSRPRPCARVLA